MTRAKSELAVALVAALALVVLLAWYEAPRAPLLDRAVPATGQIVRTVGPPVPQPATETAAASDSPAPEIVPAAVLAQDRAFINEVFPVLSSWTVSEVKPLLSVAARAASTDEELEAVMTTLEQRLGDLQYFEAPRPVAVRETLARGTDETANLQPYEFTAYYAEGAAEVSLVLEKQARHSSLYSFDISIPN